MYVVIGGQHLAAAIRDCYKFYVDTKGYKDADVAEVFKVVHAEVLRSEIPLQLARQAAGDHQRQQLAARPTCMEDVFRMLVDTMRKEKQAGGSEYLNDDQLYKVLEVMAIPQENLLPKKRNSQEGATPKKAGKKVKSVEDEMVCLSLLS